jgi:hypothetical protein
MSPTAAILRAAAAEPTPAMPEQLSSWVYFESDEWLAVRDYLDNPHATNGGLLWDMTDDERRAFLILVAEVIDSPVE